MLCSGNAQREKTTQMELKIVGLPETIDRLKNVVLGQPR